jgi:two-component system sensor histidine kinase MprB
MTSPLQPVRRQLERIDRGWRDLPLRTRLTTAASLAATVTIVAVVAVAYLAVRHELRAQVDNELRQQVADVHVAVVAPGTVSVHLPPSLREVSACIQAFDNLDEVGSTCANSSIPITAHDHLVANGTGSWSRDAVVDGVHVRVLTQSKGVTGFGVQAALPLTGVDRQLHTLALFFIVLAAAGLGLTVVASWAVVRRGLRPVKSLTETAEQIAETRDLTLRISSFGNDELGRLALTFNTMLDELERSLGAQRQLVMDASHELRTPLASLRTNVEVLADVERMSAEQRRAVLAGIVSQLEELTGLVADVVELARGEAPQSLYDDLSLDELVERAVDRARRHWPAIEFRLTTAPVRTRGVASRLDRAVANMLDNAGKFSPSGSAVDVTLAGDGTLMVADRGPGVPEQALPFVFDRFYRADEARAMPGSGLGLAIVKQVVDEHNGTIGLANRPGGGALATMTLPVTTEPVSAVPRPVEDSLFH